MRILTLLPGSSRRVPRWTALLTCFALLSTPAWSQDRDREARAAEEKIHALMKRVEDLKAAGKRDEAEKVVHKAEELKQRLHRASAERERGHERSLDACLHMMGLQKERN